MFNLLYYKLFLTVLQVNYFVGTLFVQGNLIPFPILVLYAIINPLFHNQQRNDLDGDQGEERHGDGGHDHEEYGQDGVAV